MILSHLFHKLKSLALYDKLSLLILAFGTMIRMYRLPEFVQFLGDQGRDAIIIKRIITLENLPAIGAPTSVGQVYLGPFYYYLMAPFLWLWQLDPAGLAYGVAIIFSIMLLAIWYSMRHLAGQSFAFWLVLFFTLSATMIQSSRFSWNPNLLPVFICGVIIFTHLFLEKKNIKYLAGAILLFALSLQLHYLVIFIIPGLLFYILKFCKNTKTKFNLKKIFITMFLIFGISFLPLILFDLKHGGMNLRSLFNLAGQEAGGSDAFLTRLIAYPVRLADVASGLWYHATNLELGLLALPFLVLVLFLALRQAKDNFLRLNIFNLISFLVFFAFLATPRHWHYYGPAYGSFFIILASLIKQGLQKKNIKYLSIIFIGVFLFFNITRCDHLWSRGQDQIGAARTVATTIAKQVTQQPLQVVPLPNGATDGHIRYFLEIDGYQILAEDSPAKPAELYAICFDPIGCEIIGSGHWQIANLQNKKVTGKWPFSQYQGGFVYRVTPID